MNETKGNIAIIGAGFSGIITASILNSSGYSVKIYDKLPEINTPDEPVVLWPNTIALLEKTGLLQQLLMESVFINALEIHNIAGDYLQSFNLESQKRQSVSISSKFLYNTLLDTLPPSHINLKKQLIRHENQNNGIISTFEDGSTVTSDIIIGADGINSIVREQIANDGKAVFRGYAIWKGVLEFSHKDIPGSKALEILGSGKRFGIIPFSNGKVGWWGTANETIKNYAHMSGRKKKLAAQFRNFNSPIPEIINATPDEDIVKTLVFDRTPINKWHEGKAVLIGDAAHASTPDRMNGINLAIEDAFVLCNLLNTTKNTETAFTEYEKARITRTSILVDKSLDHGDMGQWGNKWAVRLRNYMIKRLSEEKKQTILNRMFSYSP